MRALALLVLMAALLSVRPAHAAATRIAADVPQAVAAQWDKLARQYPAVAKRIERIEVRHAGNRWTVSYERNVVYLNADKGDYALSFVLTREFAKRAYDYYRVWSPSTARRFTLVQFQALMLAGVR